GGLYAWDVIYLLPVVAWGVATAAFLASVLDRAPTRRRARPSWRRHGWLAAWPGVSAALFIAIPEPPGRPPAAPFVIGNPVFAQAQGEALPPALGLVGTDPGAGATNFHPRRRDRPVPGEPGAGHQLLRGLRCPRPLARPAAARRLPLRRHRRQLAGGRARDRAGERVELAGAGPRPQRGGRPGRRARRRRGADPDDPGTNPVQPGGAPPARGCGRGRPIRLRRP